MDIKPIQPQATGTPPEKQGTDANQQQLKQQQNQAILETSLQVSLSSGNDSLSLLYRTAVEELNKVLEADLGPNAIQQAYDSGLDVSPEATAERIVSLSTAFFSSYQEQHTEMDFETQIKSFTELISGGIDQGFAEARDILDSLQVLEGDIATNIDSTYDLVQEKLSAFMDALLNPEQPASAEE